ncbi:MAG: hypothetical protein Q8S84_00070 [bacterium]|nr:hypothetical protein [bacterium]MDP3379994.1 hypothetical protein [bacterium]
MQSCHITVFHLKYVLGQIMEFFHINTFHSIYVHDLSTAHCSKTIFHLIVTHSSTVQFISDFDNLFKKCAFDVNISQGYHTSMNSHCISNALKGNCFANSFIASVISYSHLADNWISSAISIIFQSNLYTHRFAKSPMNSFGFSTICFIFPSFHK